MGGNTGGILVRESIKKGLTDPTVHGQLPAKIAGPADAAFGKDSGSWTPADCKAVARAADWALCNLK